MKDAVRMNFPSPEQLLATAAQFLIQGNEHNAASVLLSCSIEQGQHRYTRGSTDEFDITLRCSRDIFEQLQPRGGDYGFDEDPPLVQALRRAIQAALPSGGGIANLEARAALVQLSSDWKDELLQIARGIDVHNQALDAKAAWTWNNLRFRSASETKIAGALDKVNGVWFLPNCRGRVGAPEDRKNREADFLVCHKGKWGILEVDGEAFHPPSRTTEDHERDRLFKLHGIKLVEHFDATDCFNDPEKVVKQFLYLLANS